jgi:hypothetical protein
MCLDGVCSGEWPGVQGAEVRVGLGVQEVEHSVSFHFLKGWRPFLHPRWRVDLSTLDGGRTLLGEGQGGILRGGKRRGGGSWWKSGKKKRRKKGLMIGYERSGCAPQVRVES